MNNFNQYHKNLTGGSPKQGNITGLFRPPVKKMITEMLLILPLYLILFFIWWRFRDLIRVMPDVGDILNDVEFFGDAVDTPKEGTEKQKKTRRIKECHRQGQGAFIRA